MQLPLRMLRGKLLPGDLLIPNQAASNLLLCQFDLCGPLEAREELLSFGILRDLDREDRG